MLLFLVQNIPLLEKFPCQEYPSFEDRKIWVSPPWQTRYPGSVYPFAGNRPRAQLSVAVKNLSVVVKNLSVAVDSPSLSRMY